MGDLFDVSVNDLTPGSQAFVDVTCDYCGKHYELMWVNYIAIKRKTLINLDCCKDCCQKKAIDVTNMKYGSVSEKYYRSNDKRKNTNIEKFGCENPFSSDAIKEKIIQTNISKYGVRHNQQNDDVRSKTRQTCLKRYGVENYVELFRGRFVGENSPVWKGGVEYSRVERATHKYIEWRKSVFDRDLYTCQKCGSRETELHAHHIKNWHDNLDCRYSEENGITLCACCHYKFHSIYGKRNNSIEQMDDFLCLDEKLC